MATIGTITVTSMIPRIRRDLLNQVGTDSARLLELFNRTQLNILRYADWKWMYSPVKSFITEEEQTDYYIGTSTAPLGTVNTGLSLSDVGRLLDSEVFDRTNGRQLARTNESPLGDRFSNPDGTLRRDRPRFYRNAPDTPYVINIYPGPDNLNNYLQVPPTPVLTATGSGSGSSIQFLYAKVTLVDTLGNESTPSDVAAKQVIAADSWAKVSSPNPRIIQGTSGVRYDRWNVYVGTSPTALYKQNASPTNVGTDWTQSGALLTVTAPPTTNNLTPIDGYLIEFRYFKSRPQITESSTPSTTTLEVPDDYTDVVINGVSWMLAKQLGRGWENDVSYFFQQFEDGKRQMLKDRNMGPAGCDFIHPDPISSSANSGGLFQMWGPFENISPKSTT